MLQRTNLIWFFGTLLLVRIIAMIVVPLADTTEPRYAEIARLMLTTNHLLIQANGHMGSSLAL